MSESNTSASPNGSGGAEATTFSQPKNPEKRERKIPMWLTATATVVAIVGTTVGLYFALWPRTPVRTLQQWSRDATAVCEQYRGELVNGYREATVRLADVLEQGVGTSTDAAAALDDASNVYRGMVGRIRALQPPTDDTDVAKVDAALTASDQLDSAWAQAATMVEQLDLTTATPGDLQAILDAIETADTQGQATTSAFVAAGTPACGIN